MLEVLEGGFSLLLPFVEGLGEGGDVVAEERVSLKLPSIFKTPPAFPCALNCKLSNSNHRITHNLVIVLESWYWQTKNIISLRVRSRIYKFDEDITEFRS